ncbi:hypothetical protein [Microtetraspora malaysiensis]|uniref:hypothetical protein n=1 Tax=Microtetraspora malaysiensis TaxID=161358 RepID=UPI003D94B6CB
MGVLLGEVVDEVFLREGVFVVVDQGIDSRTPSPWDHDPDNEVWFQAAENGAVISSDHDNQDVQVRLELWDGMPAEMDAWDRCWTGDIFFSSGKVAVDEYYGRKAKRIVLDLGCVSMRWAVRAYMKQLRPVVALDSVRRRYGLEAYLIQFWPSTSVSGD